ncbi:MAG TPA: hypothetical protein VHJ20_22650 [Polyangia bacterium]|nr:hypothetical protein [Polyangia bacterium]
MARGASGVLALALVASGCMSVTYGARQALLGTPSRPATRIEAVDPFATASTPGLVSRNKESIDVVVTRKGMEDVEDRIIGVDGRVSFDVRIDGGDGVDVLDMMWSPPSAPPCEGAHPARALLLDRGAPKPHTLSPDRQVHWERPIIVRGERVVAAQFDEDEALVQAPSVVDVRVITHEGGAPRESCVRVPATGPDVTYWGRNRWSFGARLAWRSSLGFTPSSTFTFGPSVGRWVGPVRVGVEAFFGGTWDDKPDLKHAGGTVLCFASAGPDCEAVDLVGFGLEVSGVAKRWGRGSALGWSAGVTTFFADLTRLDPTGGIGATRTRSASASAPRLAVQWLAAAPTIAGVAAASPTSALGLELFVEAPYTWSGEASGHHVDVGLSLLWF